MHDRPARVPGDLPATYGGSHEAVNDECHIVACELAVDPIQTPPVPNQCCTDYTAANMRRLRRRIVSFALIVGAVGIPALSTTPALAAGWLPVQDLPIFPDAIAVDGTGDAFALGVGADNTVRASLRPFGGDWGPATTFASAGDTNPEQPKVTSDAAGNAVAVWSAYDPVLEDRVLRLAHRPTGGPWSAPILFSSDAVLGSHYALATDGRGITTVVWSEFRGGVYTLRGVSRPTGGPWTTDVDDVFDIPASPEGSATYPSVGAGPNGAVTVAWVAPNPDADGPNLIWASSRNAAGTWSPVNDISDGGFVSPPQAVVDRNGRATVIWDRGGAIEPTVRGASRPAGPGGVWSLTGSLGTGTEGHVAVDADGSLTLVWLDSYTAGSAIKARTKPAGGSWDAPVELASSQAANALRHPVVALDEEGDATAIWGRFDPVNATAEVARRLNGTWRNEQAPLPVGALTTVPAGAIDPQGHVTLAWTAPGSLPGASSIFDPVAPELRNLAVPQKGVAGEPVRVSVEPFDVGAVTTTWSFGAASASGSTASHAFATPGVFTITVTAEDAAGNTSELSTPITIEPASVSDPPPGRDPDPKPAPKPTVQAPALSGLQQTSSRWTVRKRRGSRVPVGTSFRFRLDRSAEVRLSFEQLVPGRRSGKRCVKATKKNRAKRACTRTEQRGSLAVKGKAGANGVEFRGRVGTRTLKPGRYRVLVVASADGEASKAATKTFTIVR